MRVLLGKEEHDPNQPQSRQAGENPGWVKGGDAVGECGYAIFRAAYNLLRIGTGAGQQSERGKLQGNSRQGSSRPG
jgi:hypothetical protein